MSRLHVYTEPEQPATCWKDVPTGNVVMTFMWHGRKQLYCHRCLRRRWAKNCVVQSYYDGLRVWCASGKGCARKLLKVRP